MSIKKVFELLKLNNQDLGDIQVLNIISKWSPKHLDVCVAGLDLPVRGQPLPGQSAGARLDNLIVEIHRIFRLPSALSLLQRDRHNLCGSHLANHDKLGTDILGVWPVLPKLKCGKQQVGILVTEDSRYLLDDTIRDIGSVTSDLPFELNVLMLGNHGTITDLVDNPMIASIGFIDESLDMPVMKQHNGYLGLPAYELLAENTQRDILGYMASMDIVIDLCGPRAAGIMMNLKARGVHTGTCIANVDPQSFAQSQLDMDRSIDMNDPDNQYATDPVAIQAYSGAYKSLIVDNLEDAQKLISYGVSPSTMVKSPAEMLTLVFDALLDDESEDGASAELPDDGKSDAARAIAA